MANQRQGVPAGWTWRDGRPRWIPSPTLRKAGWKGKDLKDGRGEWLGRAPSIAAADDILAAVAAWRAGAPAPLAFEAIAPPGACEAGLAADEADPFAIGALIDAYASSNELLFKKNGAPRPPKTVADYKAKLKRLVDTLAGYAQLPARDATEAQRAAYAAATARVRQMSVFALEPEETADGMSDPLYDAYWALRRKAGVNMAFGVLAVASAWLSWCHKRRSRRIINWARDVERETPKGRIRVMTWEEIAALVEAADRIGRPEVADALILAIDLSWSQVDILNLTWDRVVNQGGTWRALTGEKGRQKTGRVGGTPFLSLGARRLTAIRSRQAAMAAQPLRVVHLQRQRVHRGRKPASDSDFFRHLFEEVRAEAAKKVASCATLTFADTRDTGFTLSRQAGLNDDQTASRSLHSRKNIRDHADRAYGEIGPEIADAARELLDPYVEAQLAKHGVRL